MKTTVKFLQENPSYIKCSSARISMRIGIKESTINKFKKTALFKIMSNQYRNGLAM